MLPQSTTVVQVRLELAAWLNAVDPDAARVARGAVASVFDTLMRRLGMDPWLPVDTSVLPNSMGIAETAAWAGVC
jgi:hypothetical protein